MVPIFMSITAPLALISTGETAGPIYLECEHELRDKTYEIRLTVDEAKAIVIKEAGPSVTRYDASFTADKVTFGGNKRGDSQYSISRIDLSYTWENRDFQTSGAGQCKIVEPPKRLI